MTRYEELCEMDVILRDSHADTRIKRCIPMNVTSPNLEYAEVRKGNLKLKKLKKLKPVPMAAAWVILGCWKTTTNTTLRAELGMHPLETNRDASKRGWEYSVKKVQRTRLPAMVDCAMSKEVAKGQAGIWWNRQDEKV